MPQISFHVPDVQVPFILELLAKFEFVDNAIIEKEEFTFSDEQKKSVEIERDKSKKQTDYLLDWEDVKDKLIID